MSRGMAMFRTCGTFRTDIGVNVNIHAGVMMELLSGSAGIAPRAVVKSTLTGDVYRPNTNLVIPITGLDDDAIGELALDVECDCP